MPNIKINLPVLENRTIQANGVKTNAAIKKMTFRSWNLIRMSQNFTNITCSKIVRIEAVTNTSTSPNSYIDNSCACVRLVRRKGDFRLFDLDYIRPKCNNIIRTCLFIVPSF